MIQYTAADMLAQLVAGAQVVLPWIAAAVGAALVLFMLYLGIRIGFQFFAGLVGERAPLNDVARGQALYDASESSADADWFDAEFRRSMFGGASVERAQREALNGFFAAHGRDYEG